MSELLPSADDVYTGPDAAGFFGAYGGAFVPETVIPAPVFETWKRWVNKGSNGWVQ